MKSVKIMGLTIILTALLGAASASASQFRAEEYPTPVTSEQAVQQKFKTPLNIVIKCNTATTSGVLSEASSATTLTPAYSGCKIAGNAATASANSCKYVMHSTTVKAPLAGSMDIACSKEGDAIEIASSSCTIKFPAQSSLGAVEFTNKGRSRNRSITAALDIVNLKYVEAGAECPAPGTHEGATLTGSFEIKGVHEEPDHAVGVYLANEQEAAPPLFEGETYPMAFTATQQAGITIGLPRWGTFKCSSMSGTGKISGATTELNQHSEVQGCTIVGKINMHSCNFTLDPLTSEWPRADGSLGIVCSEKGDKVSFLIGVGCEVQIPVQTDLNALHFENTGSGTTRGINVKLNASGVKFTEVGSECFAPGTPHEGTLNGSWIVRAFVENGGILGSEVGLWVE